MSNLTNIKNIFRHLAVLSLNSIPSPLRKKKICMNLQPPISVISVQKNPSPPLLAMLLPLEKHPSLHPWRRKLGVPLKVWRSLYLPVRSVQTSSKTKPTLSRNDLKIENLLFTLLLIAKPCVNVAGCWVQDEKSGCLNVFPAEVRLSLTALSSSVQAKTVAKSTASPEEWMASFHGMKMMVRSWV